MLVVEGATAQQVARLLSLRVPVVYLIKHRILAKLKKEIADLEQADFKIAPTAS